jgi:hypothetical protein
LKPYVYRSIEQLNDLRLSLGVLEMSAPTGTFEKRNGASHPDQGTLFEIADEVFGANAIDIAPYIQFWDQDGKSHRLQIREWGCYEWIRKQRENAAQLWQNLCLDSPEPTWAIVGNQANRRTSWLIIKTFKVSVVTQLNLFGGE